MATRPFSKCVLTSGLKGELTLQKGARGWELRAGEEERQKAKMTDSRPLPPDSQGEAEASFLKAIDIARMQQAKSLELRAVMSVSRLWHQQGKNKKAHHLLSRIHGWFTEGFDTKDLQEAKGLLNNLTTRVAPPRSVRHTARPY